MSEKHLPAKPNHRHCEDRREIDLGPPNGWKERRRTVERRLPNVEEDAISDQEWFRCMAVFLARRRAEEKARLSAAPPEKNPKE